MANPEIRINPEARMTKGQARGRQPGAAFFATMLLVGASVLLFARLGYYTLWDDEAQTALNAEGVLQTGDTSAVIGHNVNAYRGGQLLRGLRNRFPSPLQAYVVAPFLALIGRTALAARLPFALCGLACVALIVRWLWRARASPLTWALTTIAVLGNVSFFLFFRQARYYGLTMLASVVLVYLYLHWDGRRVTLVAFSIASAALLASNPINLAAIYAALALNYAVWGRKSRRIRAGDLPYLMAPLIIIGLPVLYIWNPFGVEITGFRDASWPAARAKLLWLNLRDLARSEFAVAVLILAAPLLYVLRGRTQPLLLRGCAFLLLYVLAVTIVSPQQADLAGDADVRYLVPLIPLCVAIEVLTLREVAGWIGGWVLPLAVIAFGTNVLTLGPLMRQPARSSVVMYVTELIHPTEDPDRAAADWINAHVSDGQSIWVVPDFPMYSLMFHAPRAVYAWQFDPTDEPKYPTLPAIHFAGLAAPDYVIVFGPEIAHVRPMLAKAENRGVKYEPATTLNIYWQDQYRPELIWHRFKPKTNFDPAKEAIYIFRRTAPPGVSPLMPD
jgi:hypothetical protein